MNKVITYSAQFKMIQRSCPPVQNDAKPDYQNNHENQFHDKSNPIDIPKKLSEQNQEFISRISASGFKHFHKT